MIHYLEREWGIHFAMGGTGALVNALVQLLEDLGGKMHYNKEVSEILVEDRRVSGIRLADGTIVKADHVISNADVAWTYLKMIPSKGRSLRNSDFRYQNLTKYSMSLFVLYFGTKRRYIDTPLAHHNIILSERYKGLLNDIFNKKVLAEDFSLYLHMPTITDRSLAPEGGETFYVLSPVPHLGAADINWKKAAKPYRDTILQFLQDNYLPDLQANIAVERYIDPLYFRDKFNSHLGAGFSIQPVLTQSAWFRPHNRSEDFENLYFVGAGTHPGAGLPGVLSSSKIAEKLIAGAETASQPLMRPVPAG
jgi:phytoene desaturase